jgi:hypothetical protein
MSGGLDLHTVRPRVGCRIVSNPKSACDSLDDDGGQTIEWRLGQRFGLGCYTTSTLVRRRKLWAVLQAAYVASTGPGQGPIDPGDDLAGVLPQETLNRQVIGMPLVNLGIEGNVKVLPDSQDSGVERFVMQGAKADSITRVHPLRFVREPREDVRRD